MHKPKIAKLESLTSNNGSSGVRVEPLPIEESINIAVEETVFPRPAILKLVHSAETISTANPQYKTSIGKRMGNFCDELDRQIAEVMRL